MKIRRKLAGFSACALMLSSLTVPIAHAASFADTNGHWAEQAIDRWAGYKIVQGFNPETFKPNASMTRAQMATILAKLLGLKETAPNTFTDVASGAWYEEAILKCAAAGIMKGTSDTTANPDGTIDRQQASTMLARALGIPEAEGSLDFADSGAVADWAAGYVKAMADREIVNGVGDNTFAPKSNITRASVATILDRAISTYANEEGKSVAATDKGITLIAAKNVTVTGAAKDVLVAPAAEGTTTLDGTKVSGTLTVTAPEATVSLSGAASAANVVVADGADSATVNVAKESQIDGFTTNAADTKLNIEGKITTINLPESASKTAIAIAKGAEVGAINTAADTVTVTGAGKIATMNVTGGKGVTVAATVSVGSFKNSSDNKALYGNKVISGKKQTGGSGGSSGNGGNGGTTWRPSDPEPDPVDAQTVTELEGYAADGKTVISIADDNDINPDAAATLEVSASGTVTIDLNGNNLGDLTINAPSASHIILKDSDKKAQVRNLIVNTPNAEFDQENVNVIGVETIEAVKNGTFKPVASTIQLLRILARQALKIDVSDTQSKIQSLEATPKTGATNVVATLVGSIPSITVNGAIGLNIQGSNDPAKPTEIHSNSAEATIITSSPIKVSGSVQKITTAAPTDIELENGAKVKTVESTAAATAEKTTTITGFGNVETVSISADTKVEVPTKTVEVTSDVTLTVGAPVDEVKATASNPTVAATSDNKGSIGKITANNSLTVGDNVSAQQVELTGSDVTLTTAVDLPNVAIKGSVNLEKSESGAVGSIGNLDIVPNADATVVITANISVGQIAQVGNNNSTITQQGSEKAKDVVKKAAALTESDYDLVQPANKDTKGSITIKDSSKSCEWSANAGADASWEPFINGKAELTPGTYYVRVAAEGTTLASPAIKITIESAVESVKMAGEMLVGKTLMAAVTPANAKVSSYTWKLTSGSATTDIPNNNKASLVLTDDMVGKTVSLEVKGANTTDNVVSTAAVSDNSNLITADKSALTAALDVAAKATNGLVEKENASDVPVGTRFYNAAAKQALADAITEAKKANVDTATTATVEKAVTDLKKAIQKFTDEDVQPGTWSGKDALAAAITEAKAALPKDQPTETDDVVVAANAEDVPPAKRWVTSDEKSALTKAITAAEGSSDYDAALKTLTAAIKTFNNAKKPGAPISLTELNGVIAKAKAKVAATAVSNAPGSDVLPSQNWVVEADMNTMNSAITAAEGITTSATTMTQVNDAVKTLSDALTVFEGKFQPGIKDAVPPVLTAISVKLGNDNISVDFDSTEKLASVSYTIGAKNTDGEGGDTRTETPTNLVETKNGELFHYAFSTPRIKETRQADGDAMGTITVKTEDSSKNVASFQRTLFYQTADNMQADLTNRLAVTNPNIKGTVTNFEHKEDTGVNVYDITLSKTSGIAKIPTSVPSKYAEFKDALVDTADHYTVAEIPRFTDVASGAIKVVETNPAVALFKDKTSTTTTTDGPITTTIDGNTKTTSYPNVDYINGEEEQWSGYPFLVQGGQDVKIDVYTVVDGTETKVATYNIKVPADVDYGDAKDTLTVDFQESEGSMQKYIASVDVVKNNPVAQPNIGTKFGFELIWQNIDVGIWDFTKPVTKPMTLYATWKSIATVRVADQGVLDVLKAIPAANDFSNPPAAESMAFAVKNTTTEGNKVTYELDGTVQLASWDKFSGVPAEKKGYYAIFTLSGKPSDEDAPTTAPVIKFGKNNAAVTLAQMTDKLSTTEKDGTALIAPIFLGDANLTDADLKKKTISFMVDWNGDPAESKLTTTIYEFKFTNVTLKDNKAAVSITVDPGTTGLTADEIQALGVTLTPKTGGLPITGTKGENNTFTFNANDDTYRLTIPQGDYNKAATVETVTVAGGKVDPAVSVTLEPLNTFAAMNSKLYEAISWLTKDETTGKVTPEQSNLGGDGLKFTADTTDGKKINVTGELTYVTGFTGFNGTVKEEQNGYYVALQVPVPEGVTLPTGNDAATKTIITVNPNDATKKKEFKVNDLDKDGDTPKYFSIIWRLGGLDTAATATRQIMLDWDGDGTGATYTLDFSKMTLKTPEDIVAKFDDTGYKSLEAAVTAVEAKTYPGKGTETATVTLLQDKITATAPALTAAWKEKNVTVDFNGKTLTVTAGEEGGNYTLFIGEAGAEQAGVTDDPPDAPGATTNTPHANCNTTTVTWTNGTLLLNNTVEDTACVCVERGHELNVKDMTGDFYVNGAASTIFVRGKNATLNVENSTLKTNGVFVISTNATKVGGVPVNGDIKITVKNSKLIGETPKDAQTKYPYDHCAVLMNVPGELTIEDSEITSTRQGILLRAGTANLTGTTITTQSSDLGSSIDYAKDIDTNKDTTPKDDAARWDTGDEAPYGAVIVGKNDRGAGANVRGTVYAGDINLTMNNCTLDSTGLAVTGKTAVADNRCFALLVDDIRNTKAADSNPKGDTITISGSGNTVKAGLVLNKTAAKDHVNPVTIANDFFSDETIIYDSISAVEAAADKKTEAQSEVTPSPEKSVSVPAQDSVEPVLAPAPVVEETETPTEPEDEEPKPEEAQPEGEETQDETPAADSEGSEEAETPATDDTTETPSESDDAPEDTTETPATDDAPEDTTPAADSDTPEAPAAPAPAA